MVSEDNGVAMTATNGHIMLNGACLDLEAGTLTRGTDLVPLRPRSFAVLDYLARRPNKVVSKTELLDAVWSGVFVTEDSLTQAIRDIRLAIADTSGECLRTFRGRGYSIHFQEAPVSDPVVPDRTLRLAILPFSVEAVSAAIRPLVSALVDEVVGGLSRFRTLTVVARGSAEAAAARDPDPRSVAALLGAQYLVQGTALEGPDGLRLRLALIDGIEGTLVWSDSFDVHNRRLAGSETSAISQIIMHLNAGLEEEIDIRLSRQKTANLTAFGHFARGRRSMQAFTQEGLIIARDHFKAAVDADPSFADAWAFLGWAEIAANDYRMAPPDVLDRAYGYAQRGVDLSPNESLPVSTFGFVQTVIGEYDAAEANITKGLRLNPSNVDAMMDMANLLLFRGRPVEALDWIARIEEINPLRYQYVCKTHRSEASYMLGKYREAARELKFVKSLPARRGLWVAAALAKAGETEDLAPYFTAFAEAYPGMDPLVVAAHCYNYEHPSDTEHLLDGLRLALSTTEAATRRP